jgi:hypothetical protein
MRDSARTRQTAFDAAPPIAGASWWCVGVIAMVLTACGDRRRGVGDQCEGPEQCSTNFCYSGQCLNPAGDEDGDGLTNSVEAGLGSDPFNPDSDGDGIADRFELGPSFEQVDSDGDGVPDILESVTADDDGDCLVDQLDPDHGQPAPNLEPMIALVCSTKGICGEPNVGLRVVCPDGGAAVCDYNGVAGWSESETACDGRDEDCDGQVDDGFPDRNNDGVAECGRTTMRPFAAVSSGGGEIGDGRYRARLMVGPPIIGTANGVTAAGRLGAQPIGTMDSNGTEVP